MATKKITLAIDGHSHVVEDFTLGQLEDLQTVIMTQPDAREHPREQFATNHEIIAIALRDKNPEMTAEKVRAMRIGTIQDMTRIVGDILDFGGFAKRKEPSPGEATADPLPGSA